MLYQLYILGESPAWEWRSLPKNPPYAEYPKRFWYNFITPAIWGDYTPTIVGSRRKMLPRIRDAPR